MSTVSVVAMGHEEMFELCYEHLRPVFERLGSAVRSNRFVLTIEGNNPLVAINFVKSFTRVFAQVGVPRGDMIGCLEVVTGPEGTPPKTERQKSLMVRTTNTLLKNGLVCCAYVRFIPSPNSPFPQLSFSKKMAQVSTCGGTAIKVMCQQLMQFQWVIRGDTNKSAYPTGKIKGANDDLAMTLILAVHYWDWWLRRNQRRQEKLAISMLSQE